MKDFQENRRVEGKLHTLLLICWFSSPLWVCNGSTIPWNLPRVLCLLSQVYVFSSMLKNPHLQNTFTTKVRSNKNRNRFQFELLESIFCLRLQECLWSSLYDCLPYRLVSDVETTSLHSPLYQPPQLCKSIPCNKSLPYIHMQDCFCFFSQTLTEVYNPYCVPMDYIVKNTATLELKLRFHSYSTIRQNFSLAQCLPLQWELVIVSNYWTYYNN